MTSLAALCHILDPISPQEFLTDYFEKKPLHLVRNQPDYYREWFDLDSFFRLVTGTDPCRLRLKAVAHGQTVQAPSLAKTLELFRQGATLALQMLEELHGPVAALCRHFESFFYHPFQTNAYFTPRGNQGFGLHFDSHDVFVLQVYGSKHWKVYDAEMEFPMERPYPALDLKKPRQVLLDTMLQPGDFLYLPRGFSHEAAAADSTSLHLSVGLNAFTWRDLIKTALDSAVETHPALRASVPFGPHVQAAQAREGLEKALQAVLEVVQGSALKDAEQTFAYGRPMVGPSMKLPEDEQPIDKQTRFRRHPLVICYVESGPEHSRLYYQGQFTQIRAAAKPVVDYIFSHDEEFSVETLPAEVDEALRLHITNYLYTTGLLQRL